MVKVLHFSSTILHLPTEDNTTKIQLTLKVFSRGTAKQRLGSIPQRISNMSLRFLIQRKQWTSLWRFHQSNACKIQIKCSSSLLRALSRSLRKSSHGDFEVLQVKFFMVKRERVICFESYFASSSSINFLIKAGFSIRSSFASEKNLVSPYKETGSCWGTQTVSYHMLLSMTILNI